jgi:hypothetical protein
MYGIPAPWLPTQYEDVYYEQFITCMPGRPVALTVDGFLVPAGLRVDWAAAAGGDTILTYLDNDVNELVVDLTTGEVLTAATSYNKTAVLAALRERGLVGAAANIETYISKPVGVAAQAYYAWGSNVGVREVSTALKTFNPADFKFHNYRMQHQVQVLCDYCIRVPWLASAETTEAMDATLTGGAPTFGAANLYASADVLGLVRYSDITNTNFIAWFSASSPIAVNTTRTPISANDAALLVRRRMSPDQLTAAGDYYVDYDAGVWFFYVSGGASVPAYVSGTTLTFNEYATVPTTVSDYVSCTGAIVPGSFVEVDANSNYTLSTSTSIQDVLGQVLGFIKHPRDKLDRVKTRYQGLGTVNQMPGTATSGYPDTLNNTTTGADTEVIINLITR